eukprot:TRINITY_DN2644_c0_g1::TRINITY_DN2644_c0_g1_i2::g.26020::m.26020 TRINITY_DN2644_c0_g1::TRINITY_DN2644_c0_g1_i2::g.26020  ORF type:complete len:405 (+),score=110.80,sp/Q9ZVI9/PECT1_ARATH/56.45/7e-147,CTP_transf_2/PF01467.21/7.6e-14,CTP_transf_2/PF01467.21/3.9e-12,CTP_transf_2/PF01467.21/5.5e+03,FAD_syn/PF06574.7/1.9,FAD_syn/PF06574.7/1.7e+02,FAD_syn/PF06574.7/73 TRINITY_DN2644_c0_g1_i2:39-1217(+)
MVESKDVLPYVDAGLVAVGTYKFLKAYFLARFEREQENPKPKKPIRVYMDGCFDMMHFGHANALRQAKALGDVLVVGVVSDAEIVRHKGPPVMNGKERLTAVTGCRFVDEVIEDAPYDLTPDFLHKLINVHKIDIVVHGDDPCTTAEGTDAYAECKRLGMYRQIKRTEGVSSTDIVGRMLLCTRDHHVQEDGSNGEFTRETQFLPTSRRIMQFSSGRKPNDNDRIVYVDGAWDLFHPGHVESLQQARALGDFLIVGVHTDQAVNQHRGHNFPIMNLHERTLSVLSCKYVDEVIIGAPWKVTTDLIRTMNISMVVHGTTSDPSMKPFTGEDDPYQVPKETGIFKEIKSTSNLTASEIIQRIIKNRDAYEKRNESKVKKEEQYYKEKKQYVAEM